MPRKSNPLIAEVTAAGPHVSGSPPIDHARWGQLESQLKDAIGAICRRGRTYNKSRFCVESCGRSLVARQRRRDSGKWFSKVVFNGVSHLYCLGFPDAA